MKTPADFPDWMGPMLVKELRQGLKTKGFVLSFITLQAVLVVVLIYNVLDYRRADRNFSAEALSSIFWMLICAQLIFITPLRALNELAAERKANTLELIFMSGLTAWGITFGKWVSLLFQALLFVLAILPYAILRYYFGGVNLTEDLVAMGVTLLFCALISAVALAISGLPIFARIAAMVVAAFFLMGIVPQIMFAAVGRRGMGRSFSAGMDEINWWIIVLDFAAVSLIALEIAAATVAPLAENHVGRQRAWALLTWLPVPVLMALKVSAEAIGAQLVLFTIIAAILSWHHLSSVPFPLRSFCRPFAGKRALLGIPFQPGWPSAMIFLTLCVALVAGPIFLQPGFDTDFYWFAAGCIMGGAALLTSTLMWVVVRRRARRPLVEQSIFLVLCAAAVLLVSAGVSRNYVLGDFLPMAFLPPMAVFSMWQSSSLWREWAIVGAVAFGSYGVVLLLISRKYWVHYFGTCRHVALARRASRTK